MPLPVSVRYITATFRNDGPVLTQVNDISRFRPGQSWGSILALSLMNFLSGFMPFRSTEP